MNFIFEDIDRENFNIEEYTESLRRAKALADNKQVILNLFGDTEDKWNVKYDIYCTSTNYADEFVITKTVNNLQERADIEVLTSKQAESNEKEEIDGGCVIGVDNYDSYKLGETVQTYTQIGDTDYWYREL